MRLSEAQLEAVAALFAQCADYTPREEWGKFLREFKEHKKAPLAGVQDPSAAREKNTPLV